MVDVGETQPSVGSAIPGQIVLGCIRQKTKQAIERKPLSSLSLWLLPLFPFEYISEGLCWDSKSNKPFLLQVVCGRGVFHGNRKQTARNHQWNKATPQTLHFQFPETLDHVYAHRSYIQRNSENMAAWLVSEQVSVAMTNVNSMWIAEFSANKTAGSKRQPPRYRMPDKHP